MHEAGAGDVVERLADRPLDADPVDLAHRVDADAMPRAGALGRVERPDADERDAVGVDGGERPRSLSNAPPTSPSAAASTIPWTFPLGEVSGRVQVAVRVDPEDAADLADGGETAERPQADRVVAAEHERDEVAAQACVTSRRRRRDALADLRQVARPARRRPRPTP